MPPAISLSGLLEATITYRSYDHIPYVDTTVTSEESQTGESQRLTMWAGRS